MLKFFVRDKKQKNDCNICFENKECIQCLKCKRCFVCDDCILSMCENGISTKCPICRQQNWKKSKIFPINNVVIMAEQKQNTSHYVIRDERVSTIALSAMTERGRFYYKLMMTGIMIIFSWMCGFITVIIFTGKKINRIDINLITWAAFIIGFVEVHLFFLCCFAYVCKQPIRNKKDYCDKFYLCI